MNLATFDCLPVFHYSLILNTLRAANDTNTLKGVMLA